ncbi:unnamed protein product [Protopolystoma xenopodis]|uniref:Lysosomal dipeptide transporter MFSD1 n=1 Tax=Protopolystoma xenopodis TaxID=117903 RepID=A0A448WS86_9PLAT|nr:unnamed protein product [Protopolystoma xenopodis]
MYAFYSWPNVVLSAMGGFLIDRVLGLSYGGIVFSTAIFAGQLLLALGAYLKQLPLMYFARFVFGIGGESLQVVQNTYCSNWFAENQLNFVFGIQLSVARLGSTVNMNTMHKLYDWVGNAFGISKHQQLGISLLIASATCFLSLLKEYIFLQQSLPETISDSSSFVSSTQAIPSESPTIKFSDILHFPISFWAVCIICVLYYATVFPFIGIALLLFVREYGMSLESAEFTNSLVYIISAFASPVFGVAIDLIGCSLFWVTAGVLFTFLSHALFVFSFSIPPMLNMIILGLSYSILASSLWPIIGFILPKHQRGTGYGLIQSIQNLGLALMSIFIGLLVDTKGILGSIYNFLAAYLSKIYCPVVGTIIAT